MRVWKDTHQKSVLEDFRGTGDPPEGPGLGLWLSPLSVRSGQDGGEEGEDQSEA